MASLAPKTSLLGYENAAHLLRRATYKITKTMINTYALKTPQQALNDLFLFTPPNPTTPRDESNGTNIPTFNYPIITGTDNAFDSDNVLGIWDGWWCFNALTNPTIEYKLTMFLHTCFIASGRGTTQWWIFDYLELLRFHSNGSLKELAVRMTRNPRMLYYLDNRLNTKNNPNQNYAREFLELFTILKGEQIATGNYTNYTEQDVQQAARVFTGFTTSNDDFHMPDKVNRLSNVDPVTKIPMGILNVTNHDSGNKTFSAAFNYTIIQGGSTESTIQQELVNFVDMVFNKSATAKSYCRRLYRYFVKREITQEIETDIITPLSDTMMANNYNIVPVVKQLLSSLHFYDEDDSVIGDKIIGALVKSPLDLFLQLYSVFQVPLPNPLNNAKALNQTIGIRFNTSMEIMGVAWLRPLDVNGYPGYSSSPNFDKNFINTSNLRARFQESLKFILNGYVQNGFTWRLDTVSFVRYSGNFTNPSDANILVQEFYILLFTFTPQGEKHTYFIQALLGGLSERNWENDWNNYLDTNNAINVRVALNRFVSALVNSAEYQVM